VVITASGVLTIGQIKVYSYEKNILVHSHEKSIEVY